MTYEENEPFGYTMCDHAESADPRVPEIPESPDILEFRHAQ